MIKKLITIIAFLSSIPAYSLVTVNKTIESVTEVDKIVRVLNSRFGSENVLVVFDIDNTTLKTTSDVPGDTWFEWQWEQIENGTDYAVSSDHGEFLGVLKKLYEHSIFVPAEGSLTVSAVNSFQEQGNPFFYLTSRNSGMNKTTQEALTDNLVGFKRNQFRGSGLEKGVAAGNLGDSKLKKKYSKKRLGTPVLYNKNIFFTAGLHKGLMLKSFLKWTNFKPKAIVFMDDKKKHTDGVQSEFAKTDIEVYTYAYDAVSKEVENFNKRDKKEVHREYLQVINQILIGE